MLSRLLSRTTTHLRLLSHLHPPPPSSQIPKLPFFTHHNQYNHHYNHRRRRYFSTNDNNGGDDRNPNIWKLHQQPTDDLDGLFAGEIDRFQSDTIDFKPEPRQQELVGEAGGISAEVGEYDEWRIEQEEKEVEDVYEDGYVVKEEDEKSKEEREMREAAERAVLEKEKQSLLDTIQGTNRAFGDLIAASGITDAMLDSLIALKNFHDIEGLPPLEQIEDERYEKAIKKSSRYEMELQKQEEIAKSRVRKVDEQGRAYGTGKRKTSIARVWIQPGEGKFDINDRVFDVYFPKLDHRATLLRPFVETKTLGLWDIRCTVKGGGTTGQVEAIRLGISRALQNWEPGFRPPLRDAGFLTRDPRIVERKKPGRAKARKSFQWVKR